MEAPFPVTETFLVITEFYVFSKCLLTLALEPDTKSQVIPGQRHSQLNEKVFMGLCYNSIFVSGLSGLSRIIAQSTFVVS